jgi:hypothetical protein
MLCSLAVGYPTQETRQATSTQCDQILHFFPSQFINNLSVFYIGSLQRQAFVVIVVCSHLTVTQPRISESIKWDLHQRETFRSYIYIYERYMKVTTPVILNKITS